MANKFEIATIFKAVDKMTAPITKIQNKIQRMTKSVDRGLRRVQRTTQGMVDGVKNASKKIAVAGTLMIGVLGTATAAGIDFEQTIVNAAAKYPGEIRKGTEAFKQLEDAAKQTGATTEFSATQSAEALNFLAMAGFNAENSIAALPGVVDLATASNTDLATATDIATDSLGALGLMTTDSVKLSKNLSRVNDVLAKTTTSANVSMVDMFEAIKDGAPVGVAAGQDFETIATLIAKMGDAGIKGTRAGTALKNIFLSLSAPGSEAAEVMRRLGVQTIDAQGNVRDAVAVFKDFSRATKELPSSQKLAVFDKIFGKIPIAAAINVTNAADSMDAYRESLRNADGTSKKMAATMRDTTRGSINSLKSAIEGVAISLFSYNQGPMKEAIDNATLWVRANGDLIAQNIGQFFLYLSNNLGKFIETGKKIATIIGILWGLNSVLKIIRGTMLAVTLIMTANPIGLAVVALVAGAAALYVAWEPVKAFFSELWADITSIFDKHIKFYVDKINWMKEAISGLSDLFEFEAPTTASPYAGGNYGYGRSAVSSPYERHASILEQRNVTTTNKTEVVIKDETGRAEAAPNAGAVGLTVQATGAL